MDPLILVSEESTTCILCDLTQFGDEPVSSNLIKLSLWASHKNYIGH